MRDESRFGKPDLEGAATVETIAAAEAITMTQALRNPIALQRYVAREIRAGGQFLVEKPNGQIREIVIRP